MVLVSCVSVQQPKWIMVIYRVKFAVNAKDIKSDSNCVI